MSARLGFRSRRPEEHEMLEASSAFEVHESSVSILEETEDTLQVWVEFAPKDLSTELNLQVVNEEEEILQGGRIVRIEFKDALDDDKQRGQEVTGTLQKKHRRPRRPSSHSKSGSAW
jgi:hypothetical protein